MLRLKRAGAEGHRLATTYPASQLAGAHLVLFTQTMAAGIVITVPLVIVVLLFQRRIVSGLTAGGVKG